MTVQHTLLEPHLTACSRCPGWQIAYETAEQKQAAEDRHAHAKHGDPLPAQGVTGVNWQEQAVDAVRQVAARGQDFRIYDALAEFGLQSPPNHKSAVGRLATLVHDQGIAHPVGGAPSTRPATNASQAAVWNRNPSRCTSSELRCRQKAGAA